MSRLGIGAGGAAAGDPWVAMESYGINQGLGADLIATLDGLRVKIVTNTRLCLSNVLQKRMQMAILRTLSFL